MKEYIREVTMWIVTAIVAMFAINKTGDIRCLLIFIAPVAGTFFTELCKLG